MFETTSKTNNNIIITASPKICGNNKSSQKKACTVYIWANQQLVTHKLKINVVCVLYRLHWLCDLAIPSVNWGTQNLIAYIRKSVKKCHGVGTLKQFHCFEEMAVETGLFYSCYASHPGEHA